MNRVSIKGEQHPIKKIFSDDFMFTIPLYQRPYAWTKEEAGELLEDLLTFLGDGNETIDELNPYFLGSIVLIKSEQPAAEIVDGQQRLTTLTILLAALRASLPTEHANDLTTFLYQRGSLIAGTPNRYRLTLRERDADFFKEYIQNEGGINKLKELNSVELMDSQKLIKENAHLFLQRFHAIGEHCCIRLAQFIITQCFLVVVSTPDFDSAYRIFSVLNNRGLDLSVTDILKADIIGKIPESQQEKYTKKWEDTEENLGRELFKDLFSHIRMIKEKKKLSKSILKEFQENINPAAGPQQFIDEILAPYAKAFSDIYNLTYESEARAQEINQLFKWLNKIDNFDWVPPAILYLSRNRNRNNPDNLLRFFRDLDRLAAGLMIVRANINERIERYSRLLTAIEQEEDLFNSYSPLQFTPEESNNILRVLDSDLYLMQKIRRYVLVRLDAALSEGEASYNFSNITVEHVLPQNLGANSEWMKWFANQQEHAQYVHRLGNLVLLSCAKNTLAQNYDFDVKKQKYFTTKTGVSPFALTTQVLREQEWTPEVIARRQKEQINVLKNLWRL
ncbi:MAG: DUF262 domain-containing protein [Microcoleus sp. PH2017_29_MFU_D_A]|uniref:DUF262 domain-containing protein n=1 Tax=unclassified Microcoleus TaxID=2642155 RepID=UPI001DE6E307|nr:MULTISPECIES: DUF262 domain-containing HNH endonuclease family protein [unclassified Microcoleus]MCC3417029.1 DUF262 domain-containing protein [Microcoleus sp. PH2017_07_MST_O_A]MCC3429644.1 DUF262 domain-containing protein [Microcoleus sp. PH2017_04_SCI_O_A]MCC3441853.1 DUF262 domain-containing protein [Microcoleus sp. PH2017_03_ELD_O_A]MCC3501427.1 DUF262 domain-containing protein [Microcoleus sp. PH2017_19_SFW_U_A]TAE12875.1 MAG: DUF262 domain-containing protein [Oscillatoriales cyanobac